MESRNYWNELAKRAIDDETAFNELYEHYFEPVYKKILIRTKNHDAADEIISQVFYKIFYNLAKFDEKKASFNTWVGVITNNEINQYFREQMRRNQATSFDRWLEAENSEELFYDVYGMNPERQVLEKESRDELRFAISQLSERSRQVIEMKYWLEMKNSEMAEWLGITAAQVSLINNRAIKKLRKILTE